MSTDKIHVLARAVLVRAGQLLVCKTLDLEKNFYFLPGGHIEHNESAHSTIQREMMEECGLDVTIHRFLGCLEYRFEPEHSSICHNHEYSFIFEVTTPNIKAGQILPQKEAHLAITWLPLEELNQVDFRAEPLVSLLPQWLMSKPSHAFAFN
jgi:8-oxo-dGTP pyrophosphatase MutT (NUDIX family)